MYKSQDKKMIPVDILEILKRHSDENHPLKQKDILEYLKEEYLMDVDKKAVSSNLDRLIDEFDEIGYAENSTKSKMTNKYKKKAMKKGEKKKEGSDKSITKTDFFWYHDFDESELRLIIDSLLFSKYIPYSQCKDIIDKIRGLGSKYFSSKTQYITKLVDTMPKTYDKVEYNVNVIDEAIGNNKKIKFNYANINISKKYELRKNDNGEVKEYKGTPYQMVATNSRYYLICNIDGHDNIGIYRMDRIANIEILDEVATPKSKIKGLQNGLDLPKYAMEHIYMSIGESEKVTFEFDAGLINDVVDWFGINIDIKKKDDKVYIGSVNVNLKAMRFWAMQYSEFVKVVSPKSLVDDIKKQLNNTIKKYK